MNLSLMPRTWLIEFSLPYFTEIDRLRVDRAEPLKFRQVPGKGAVVDTKVFGSSSGCAVRLDDANAFKCVKSH